MCWIFVSIKVYMKNPLCDIIFKGDKMSELNLELEVCGGCNEKNWR